MVAEKNGTLQQLSIYDGKKLLVACWWQKFTLFRGNGKSLYVGGCVIILNNNYM